MNICIGGKVIGQDNIQFGKIKGIVYSPRLGEVTHIIMHKGILLPHDTLIQLSMAQGNKNGDLVLHITSDEVGQLPRYHEEFFHKGPAGSEEVAVTPEGEQFGVSEPPERAEHLKRAIHLEPDSVELTAKTEVDALDGKLGSIGCMQVSQYDNHLTYITLKRGRQGKKEISIPFEWVNTIEENRILIGTSRQKALEGLMPPSGNYIPVEPEEHGEELHEL